MITVKDLLAIAGTKSGNTVTKMIADAFNKHAAKYGVNNNKRIAQFLANVCHETGGFTKLDESLNYSVQGLLSTFGRHRITKEDAEAFGRKGSRKADQVAIANRIYGGEFGRKNLGNTQPNDGWNYRGSGPGQVTGRANFAKVQKETGLQVLSDPDILRTPESGMIAALMLWQKWGLNELADSGSTDSIRKRWNGGDLGIKEVREAYVRARGIALSVPEHEDKAPVVKASPEPVLVSAQDALEDKTAKKTAAVLAGGAVIASGAGWFMTTAHDWWASVSTWFTGFFQ